MFTTLRQAGSTALINLFVDDESKPHLVLAREIQRDVITNRVQHVDFYEVRLTEKVRTMPRIEIVGEAPIVKSGEAVLIHAMNEVEVECLPTSIPENIRVEVAELNIGDDLRVRDLPLPDGVSALEEPDAVVLMVAAPTAVEEEAAPEEVVAEPEVIGRPAAAEEGSEEDGGEKPQQSGSS